MFATVYFRVLWSAVSSLKASRLNYTKLYEGVSKRFRAESIKKYALNFGIAR